MVLPELALPGLGVLVSAGTPLELVLSMGSMGLAFALVPAVLWPSVTYLVAEERLGALPDVERSVVKGSPVKALRALGERVDLPGWQIVVVDMDGRRVDRLRMVPLPPEGADNSLRPDEGEQA